MVMAQLGKKYYSLEDELRKQKKGTPRYYKTIILFTLNDIKHQNFNFLYFSSLEATTAKA
jgi:hypothetical protein